MEAIVPKVCVIDDDNLKIRREALGDVEQEIEHSRDRFPIVDRANVAVI